MGNSASFDYHKCPPATSEYCIDPTKQYPPEYNEFMTIHCHWDFYGNHGMAYENSMITEKNIEEILERRNQVKLDKKKRHLQILEENLAKEMAQWDRMWTFAKDEINTFDISSKDAYGSQLRDRMNDHINYDFVALERVIGEKVTEDDLLYIAKHNPNIFMSILKKVFSFLIYVARMPIDWKNEESTMNNFDKVID